MINFAKFSNFFSTYSMLAVIAIPTQTNTSWQEFSFNKIKPNQVSFSESGIINSVNQSASPLVYKLSKIEKIKSFEIELKIEGQLNESKPVEFEEDSYLRLGLVAQGEKRLSGIKKMLAADWIKKMFSLAPEGVGLDKIYFFNLANTKNKVGKKRLHPKSDLMHEEVVEYKTSDQKDIKIIKTLDTAVPTAALWISIDGDDTKSKFVTTIKTIKLITQD